MRMATPRFRFRKRKREVSFDCQLRFSEMVGSVAAAVEVPTRGLEAGLGSGIVRGDSSLLGARLESGLLLVTEMRVEG